MLTCFWYHWNETHYYILSTKNNQNKRFSCGIELNSSVWKLRPWFRWSIMWTSKCSPNRFPSDFQLSPIPKYPCRIKNGLPFPTILECNIFIGCTSFDIQYSALTELLTLNLQLLILNSQLSASLLNLFKYIFTTFCNPK